MAKEKNVPIVNTDVFAPDGYLRMHPAAKSIVCNGCGSKGLGGWFVPDTLWGLNITEVCNIHDYMYLNGKTIEDKESADRVFLNNMLRVIKANEFESNRLIDAMRRNRAFNYFQAVQAFGGPAFWVDKNGLNDIVTISDDAIVA